MTRWLCRPAEEPPQMLDDCEFCHGEGGWWVGSEIDPETGSWVEVKRQCRECGGTGLAVVLAGEEAA